MNSRFLKASKALRERLNGKPRQPARAKKRQNRLRFESLEDRRLLAASPALLSSVEGFNIDDNAFNTGASYVQPPDPYGAVGQNHIVNVGNVSIQFFSKAGAQQYHTSLKNFFSPLRPDYGVFDPKVLYDQYSNRFVVVALEAYEVGNGDLFDMSRIMLAVSDDADPNGNWYFHSIDGMVNVPDPTTPGVNLICWTDYPGFALDEEALYVTGNLFEFGTGDSYGNRLWIVDKGLGKGGFYDNGAAAVNIYDPATLTGVDFSGNNTLAQNFRNMQPAHVFGTAPTGVGTWLALYDGLSNGVEEFVDVIRVNNPLTTPTFTRFSINVGDIEDTTIPIDFLAPQRGVAATIDFGDRRTTNAVWRDNALYVATVVYPKTGPDINQITAHWFKFDTTNAQALKLSDQGNVGGEELGWHVNTGWPAVQVDAQGNMAIGFAAAGPNLYAGAYYAVRAASDPAGTVRTAGTVAAGLDSYGYPPSATMRWGDYTSIALDPTDGATFWAYNEYALPSQILPGRWGTRWGSFRLADAVTPPPTGPATITGLVWHDLDENRKRDLTEAGLSGWTVYADLDGDGERDIGEPSVKTDSQGKYTISNLTVTGNTVTIREAIKPGWRQTLPGDPLLSHVVTLTGTTISNINFGNSDNDGFDHGDAPAPYPTLESANGPTHAILTGLGLGVESTDGLIPIVDGEPDGLPDSAALGDDNDNTDDENGIVFGAGLAPGKAATVTVTVSTGANAPGMLQGWIDFNRDGDWADAGEQVFVNRALAAGTHVLTINVPSTAIPGTTFARFRYGYENNLSYVGASYAGEVEDYRVDILSDKPVAVDDNYTVDQDSRDNVFDVLANDIPSSSGIANLRIKTLNTSGTSGTATFDNNGTPSDYTDDFIRYTPAPGAFAPDAFAYTVEDTVSGVTDAATVYITVIQSGGNAPFAVDDSYLVPPQPTGVTADFTGSAPYLLDVLKNDRVGPTGSITIPSGGLDTTGTVGTVTWDSATQKVRYTPPASFNGTDQFRYTIRDSNNATSIGTVTIQTGTTRTADDLVRYRLVTTDLNGNPITEIGQGLQFQVMAYVKDMRNETGYQQVPGLPTSDKGVYSAYMDLLYDSGLVSYAGPVTFSSDYPDGQFFDATVPGTLNEIGAFRGSLGLPPTERLLFKAVFTATALGTAKFKSDPADVLPLHETALNKPVATSVDYPYIDYQAASINVVESPDLVQIRLQAVDLQGNPLTNNQVAAGTQFYVRALVDDIRTTVPTSEQGAFSAYLDITYNSTLARPVTVPTSQNPLGFDITAGPLFGNLKGINQTPAGTQTWYIDEVGAYQGLTATTFGGEQLLFQIKFVAQAGGSGTLTFAADPADDLPLNETTLIKPDPGISVPPAQVRYVSTPAIVVIGGSGEGEFTNPSNRYDVNNDGFATPIDVLALINFLNTAGTTDLTPWAAGGEGESGGPFYDVNSDNFISPSDVLSIVNYLNSSALQAMGEGEAVEGLVAVVLPAEAGAGPKTIAWPAEQVAASSAAVAIGRESDAEAAWWVAEDEEPTDYFAGLGEQGDESAEASLRGLLNEGLADDIAHAWALGTASDGLLDDLI